MQYTDNEAALISGLISTYFFQPAVSMTLKNTYSQVLNHLQQNQLSAADLTRIQKRCPSSLRSAQKVRKPVRTFLVLPLKQVHFCGKQANKKIILLLRAKKNPAFAELFFALSL